MRTLGKPKILEAIVAGQFVVRVLQGVEESWPRIVHDWPQLFPPVASVGNDQTASFEVALAVIAVQVVALRNLLPADQAARFRAHIVRSVCSADAGSGPAAAIDEYEAAWDRSMQVPEPPQVGIASLLFAKLHGSGAGSGGEPALERPAGLPEVGAAIVALAGSFWRATVTEYGMGS